MRSTHAEAGERSLALDKRSPDGAAARPAPHSITVETTPSVLWTHATVLISVQPEFPDTSARAAPVTYWRLGVIRPPVTAARVGPYSEGRSTLSVVSIDPQQWKAKREVQ
jgi:hypothetical protein